MRWWPAGVAVVMALGASIPGSGSDDSEGDDAAGLQVTVQQSTLYETQRALRLAVFNDGDREVELATIQLSSPLFEPLAPEQRDVSLRAGAVVTMPLPMGDARCDDVGDEPAELLTEVDGDSVRVAIDESPSDFLGAMNAEECAAEAVLAGVDLHLGDTWEHTAPVTVAGTVELAQRQQGVTAAVDEVQNNMIFAVDPVDPVDPDAGGEPGPWLEVGDEAPSDSIPVVVRATRCDEHAVVEYKRKYMFVALVRVGDEDPVRVDVEADGDARRAIEALLPECIGQAP